MSLQPVAAQPKPYVSIRELSGLTPWTEQAIRTMMAKSVLREGEHFFTWGGALSSNGKRLFNSLSTATLAAVWNPASSRRFREWRLVK